MEAGLALDQATGSGCVICGGLACCTLCSSLQQTHLATFSKLTPPPSADSPRCLATAREGQVFISLHSPHTHCLRSYVTFPDGNQGSLSWKEREAQG